MSRTVEEGVYDGDCVDRAQEVGQVCAILMAVICTNPSCRYMAHPAHKKLPQPPEGSTYALWYEP